MSKIGNAVSEIRTIDELANRDQWVNQIHPLVKFACTVFYITLTVSFRKYDLTGLLGMAVYPLLLFQAAELSFSRCIRRILPILPLLILLGLFNPIFDRVPVRIGSLVLPAGVLSMLTLILKGFFTVLASYLLAATTPMDELGCALRSIHVPEILVTVLLLIYRYLTLLLEEADRITQAYALRAPGQKGIHIRVWGSLIGQLLLRSMDRAQNVYESMLLRGYDGRYTYLREKLRWRPADFFYGVFWISILLFLRRYPVLILIGSQLLKAQG